MKTDEQKPPTQSQIKYARERIEALTKSKIAALTGPKYISDILDQEIKAGRFSVMLKREVLDLGLEHDSPLHKALRFTAYPGGWKDAERALTKKKDAYHVRADKIRDAATAIVDELVLGDAAGALAALRDFEKREF